MVRSRQARIKNFFAENRLFTVRSIVAGVIAGGAGWSFQNGNGNQPTPTQLSQLQAYFVATYGIPL